MDQALFRKLEETIEANIGNSSFGVKDLAREMGMSQEMNVNYLLCGSFNKYGKALEI